MKYIIEIPDKADFVTAYYMEDGLPVAYKSDRIDDLEPYTEINRTQIENEVWDFINHISDDMSQIERDECFGTGWTLEAVRDLSYQEAKAKYDVWKRQKDEIRVGDEVTFKPNDTKGVVVKCNVADVYPDTSKYAIFTGSNVEYCLIEWITKTGRSFPEIVELLRKMGVKE